MKSNNGDWITINYIKDIDSNVIKSNTPVTIKAKSSYKLFSYIKSIYQNKNRIINVMTKHTRQGINIIPQLEVAYLKPSEDNRNLICSTPTRVYRASFNQTYTFKSQYIGLNILTSGLGVCTWTIKYRTYLNGVYSDWTILFNHHNGGNYDRESRALSFVIDKIREAVYDANFKIELSIYMDSWYKYNYANVNLLVKSKVYNIVYDVENTGDLHYVLIEQ